MGISKRKEHNIFKLSEEGNAKIEYKNDKFYVYSHKAESKPIILTREDMQKLCKFLPRFQKEMYALDSDDKEKNKDLRKEQISVYKQFESFLVLNVWNEKTYLWLRLFYDPDYIEESKKRKNRDEEDDAPKNKKKRYDDSFDSEDEEAPEKSKSKSKRKRMIPCKGGTIFNDVDAKDLAEFVRNV